MDEIIVPLRECHTLAERIDRLRIFTPTSIIVAVYLLIIIIGALLLMLPWSTYSGIGFTDAIFTSTSATTVTGLVVKETGSYFTFFGQMVIIGLVQVGGLGYMSLFGFFLLSGKHQISFEHRMLLRETLNSPTVKGIRSMALRIFLFIIFIEIIGAIILIIRWLPEYGLKGAWYGIFHSVAAFNNAGFDIISAAGKFESLSEYAADFTVNMTIAWLIILGGIGFYVLSDVYRFVRKRKERLSYQTIVVCFTTALLILAGMLFFLALEYSNPDTLGKYTFGQKLLISFFNSVTPRTAGFSTMYVADFLPLTLLFILLLMFIGASPGGTGGGIKTTTVAVFWAYTKSCVTGKENVNLLTRRIVHDHVNKAFMIAFFSLVFIAVVSSLIIVIDKRTVMQAAFETTSAFGTVGLSMGITPTLGAIAKYLIMLAMFCGKIGVLTLILFFIAKEKKTEVVLPTGELTM